MLTRSDGGYKAKRRLASNLLGRKSLVPDGASFDSGDLVHAQTTSWREGVGHLLTYPFWKSIIDRFVALVAVVTLFPFLVLIAGAISLDSRGGPIFAQERAGRHGRRFSIYKFRTMYVDNDDTEFRQLVAKVISQNAACALDHRGEPVYKLRNDPRVTRVGALLRKTNLDELPQILNVLKGEMSFVGPRPEMTFAVEELYSEWHQRRLSVTPGITGMWQVYGRGRVCFDDMVRLDIEYAEGQSLLLDAKIVLRTIATLFGRNGS